MTTFTFTKDQPIIIRYTDKHGADQIIMLSVKNLYKYNNAENSSLVELFGNIMLNNINADDLEDNTDDLYHDVIATDMSNNMELNNVIIRLLDDTTLEPIEDINTIREPKVDMEVLIGNAWVKIKHISNTISDNNYKVINIVTDNDKTLSLPANQRVYCSKYTINGSQLDNIAAKDINIHIADLSGLPKYSKGLKCSNIELIYDNTDNSPRRVFDRWHPHHNTILQYAHNSNKHQNQSNLYRYNNWLSGVVLAYLFCNNASIINNGNITLSYTIGLDAALYPQNRIYDDIRELLRLVDPYGLSTLIRSITTTDDPTINRLLVAFNSPYIQSLMMTYLTDSVEISNINIKTPEDLNCVDSDHLEELFPLMSFREIMLYVLSLNKDINPNSYKYNDPQIRPVLEQNLSDWSKGYIKNETLDKIASGKSSILSNVSTISLNVLYESLDFRWGIMDGLSVCKYKPINNTIRRVIEAIALSLGSRLQILNIDNTQIIKYPNSEEYWKDHAYEDNTCYDGIVSVSEETLPEGDIYRISLSEDIDKFILPDGTMLKA